MDWSMVAAMAATVSASVALWVSPPMQKILHRHDVFKQLQPYERDILKAIQSSRLGLGSIVLRQGDIEPIIELTPSLNRNMVEHHRLIVGQAFYQLSLEFLESLSFLKEDVKEDVESYRLTGAGDQFIHKYDKKLRRASYTGWYVDLMPPELLHKKTVRRKAQIRKEPPPFEDGDPFITSFSWLKILSHERHESGMEGLARTLGHNLGLKKNDPVYIFVESPILQYPGKNVLSARVFSIEELGPVNDERMRIGEHTLMKLGSIQPWKRNNVPPT